MGKDSIKRRYWLAGSREPGQDEFFEAALDKSLWRRGTEKAWDSCWYTGMPDQDVFEHLTPTRSVNHIPGNNGLTIKSYLWKTLREARNHLAGRPQAARMDYFPETFLMPADYRALQLAAFKDPERMWLRKPVNSSRGRGVGLVDDVAAAPRDDEWMIQSYLARPHLMNGHKYVLRLYVLISSVEPLRAYVYHEGFAKLASEAYDLEDTSNVFAHLTNPDINATNENVEAPVVFIGLGSYRQWLRDDGHDDLTLFDRIHDLLRLTVISVRERMVRRLKTVEADTRGCYELLGIDCMVDADFKPWILECNLSPSLEVCAAPEDGGVFERETKSQLVADMVSLLGLNERKGRGDAALTGEARFCRDHDYEMAHRGGFLRLCPSEDAGDYLASFPAPRYADVALCRHIHKEAPALCFTPGNVGEIYDGDALALYDGDSGQLLKTNDAAAFAWIALAEGKDADTVAADIAARSDDPYRTRTEIWALFDDWARKGMIRLTPAPDAAAIEAPPPAAPLPRPEPALLACGSRLVALDPICPAAQARLMPLFAPLSAKSGAASRRIDLMPSSSGYAIALDRSLLTGPRGLDQIAIQLWQMLFELAPSAGELAIKGSIAPVNGGEAVFLPALADGGYDRLALAIAEQQGGAHGATLLSLDGDGLMSALALPARISDGSAIGGMTPAAPPRGRYAIKAIVLPKTNASGERLAPLSSAALLSALIGGLVTENGKKPDGALIEAFDDWLGERSCWLLDAGDIDAAVRVLAEKFPLRTA